MKQSAIKIFGTFEGIYAWGRGYKDSATAEAWDRYWNEIFPTKDYLFWKYAPNKESGHCGFLSSMTGSIYMHPMDFNTILVASGDVTCSTYIDGRKYVNNFQHELETLKEICEEAAAFCGGTFQIEVSKEFEIETPERYELIDMPEGDDFPVKIGKEIPAQKRQS